MSGKKLRTGLFALWVMAALALTLSNCGEDSVEPETSGGSGGSGNGGGNSGGSTISVTGVTLSLNVLGLTVGGNTTLTITITPGNATNKAVTWSSSDPAVATVVNGLVTAVSPGTATITVKTVDGGKTATCTVYG